MTTIPPSSFFQKAADFVTLSTLAGLAGVTLFTLYNTYVVASPAVTTALSGACGVLP